MPSFTLYSRSYCHLCDDMLLQLKQYLDDVDISIAILDVDADEELLTRFDELVPVLYGQKEGAEAIQICHYFLDVEKLKAFLHD
ncbi:glutaredoxin family protein [Undibacterium amnicola]|uniref:Glutaredoxin family protein n=2 Tax=Undibacterium amnicola TaxID=1834038 RepID=A0ABR6XMC6_9BURK|nr:glutaredoxin family protein [Undibacterium amnicola]MBC3830654.1 glutaredoxin family protein [Undibacterium amnicola]